MPRVFRSWIQRVIVMADRRGEPDSWGGFTDRSEGRAGGKSNLASGTGRVVHVVVLVGYEILRDRPSANGQGQGH